MNSGVSRGSVTKRYISSWDTGFTPALICGPMNIEARVISGGRGTTARQEP